MADTTSEPELPNSPLESEYHEALPPLKAVDIETRHRCKMLELPAELLAVIASQLHSTKDLLNLAVTCRRLCDVVQDVLLKPLKVPREGIGKLLEMLIDRPDLVQRVRHVDLGDFSDVGGVGEFRNTNILDRYEDLINEQFGFSQWSHIKSLSAVFDPWGTRRSFYLALLATILPNLQELSLQMGPRLTDRDGSSNLSLDVQPDVQGLVTPFHDTVMHILSRTLEVLTISEESPCFDRYRYNNNISVVDFYNLRRLSLPMDALVRSGDQRVDPLKALPESLEHLEIRACNRLLYEWYVVFEECSAHFIKLRQLVFYFKAASFRTAMLLTTLGHHNKLEHIYTITRSMAERKIDIRIFVQPRPVPIRDDGYEEVKMTAELQAWSCLGIGEIALASSKNMDFSEVVARNADGSPRERTHFEAELVRRFYNVSTALFTSPSFNPLAWSSVRMFNGADKGVKKAQKGIFRSSSATEPTTTSNVDEKKKKGRKKMASVPIDAKRPTMTSPGFDTSAWSEVQFFAASEPVCNMTPTKKQAPEPKAPGRRKVVGEGKKMDEVLALAASWKL